ncbi:MAG: restriction endonuclease subunit S [Bacteroidota bacterium]
MSEWKETEIGNLPNDWSVAELGEICTVITDGSHFSPKVELSQYYMASVKDMRYNYFEFENCKTISEKDFNSLVQANCSPNKGDILISKDGANCLDIIFVYAQPEKIVLLSSIAIARLKEGFDPYFYMYYLLSPISQYLMKNSFISGTAIPRVVLKDFHKVSVPLISYSEQCAISSIPSSLDDKIDLLHRQNKTLEQLAETLFRQWFVEEAEESWKIVKLSALGKIICGKTPSKKISEYFDGEIPFIKIPDMHDNVFVFSTVDSLTQSGAYSQYNKNLPPKSICVSCIATVGLVVMNAKTAQTNQQINSIIPVKEFYTYFLFLKMSRMKDELLAMASGGTATDNLNTGDFSNIDINLPPENMLIEFNERVNSIFEKIFTNQLQIRSLTQLRDTLLPKLMSGEVRVKNEK